MLRAVLVCLTAVVALGACSTTPQQPAATDGSTDSLQEQRAAVAAPATPPEVAPDAGPAPAPAPDEAGGVLVTTRRSLRAMTQWLARGVDSWFGDTPFEQGGKVTHGRFGVNLLKRESEEPENTVRFSARIRLPNVEEKTYLFIGRDNERELVTDTPGALTRQQRLLEEAPEEQSFFAGLGRTVGDVIDTRIGFRGGLKPYAQARYRQPWQWGEHNTLEFRETVFWTLDDHFGSTTALSYEYELSPVLAARWLNAATVTQEDRKFKWSSVAGTYRDFGERRLLSLQVLASGRHGDPVRVADYGAQAKWLQSVYQDWLLAEFIFGRFHPRKTLAEPRARIWAVGVGMRLEF